MATVCRLRPNFHVALEPQRPALPSQRTTTLRGKRRTSSVIRSQKTEAPTCDRIKRRHVFTGAAFTTLLTLQHSLTAGAVERVPPGYKVSLDKTDAYVFYYPFGWEEVVVKGQDVVYKDVIEPLESVSVNIVKTEKSNIHEFGSPEKLSKTLIDKFLTAPSQTADLVEAKEKETDGRPYYTFEFLAKDNSYTRHALGAVTVGNGKFYALITGANERRWNKMQDRLHGVVDSFKLLE